MSQNVEYCLLHSSEASLLCEGIRRAWDDSYPIPKFYDAAWISAALDGGLLHRVVALVGDWVVGGPATVLEVEANNTAGGSGLRVEAPQWRPA